MSALVNLLARLEGVRERAAGQYVAKCPAHQDRSPSLSVTEAGDGRVLVHCFAGCEVEAVVAAVGLSFSDLYPDAGPDRARQPRVGPQVDWRRVCRSLCLELTVCEVLLADYERGLAPRDEDMVRFAEALRAIGAVRRMVGGA